MRFWRRQRFLRWMALSFATATIAAPTASARPLVPQDSGGPATASADGAGAVRVAASTSANGFSWSDAAVGAAGSLSLVLIAGGGLLVARGVRRTHLAGA